MYESRTTHLDAVDKILRDLKKSPGQGICMRKNKTNTIIGYSNAYWADNYDQMSTTRYYSLHIHGWKSRDLEKQKIIT
jgi:hypothetical protein